MTVKWYGDKVMAEVNRAMPEALFEVGEELVKVAGGNISTGGSGDLLASGYVSGGGKSTYQHKKIHHLEVEGDDKTIVAGFAAFYAVFVEFGTSKMTARPFLRPAFDEMKSQITQMVADGIKRRVAK